MSLQRKSSGISLILPALAVCALIPLDSSPAWASLTRQHEIRVTLFGQPCALSGPFDEATLKMIHSVSPEQSPSFYQADDIAETSATQIRQTLERLRQPARPFPSSLDRYRERQLKRLTEMQRLVDGFDALKREGKTSGLTAAGKILLKGKNAQSYSTAVNELADLLKKKKPADTTRAKIFDLYHEAVEPDPQEEFHRATQRMNIRYNCVYEEEGSSED